MGVVVVVSPKGGAGKTTVATNLAVRLARRAPGEVVLVDLDVAFGDVGTALLLDPRRSVLDLAAGAALDDVLAAHPSGLQVVLAPDDEIPDAPTLGPHVPGIIDALTARFPIVVVDTGAGLDTVTLAAIGRATDLVLVAADDVATLLDLRKVLRLLDRAGDTSTRHLVLNRADPQLGLDPADAEGATGLQVTVVVPADRHVARVVNEGRQVDEGDAARAFDDLTARFLPPVVVEEAPAGWQRLWRS